MDKEKIKQHYDNIIKNSEHFSSQSPVNDMEMLYPDFLEVLIKCFTEYSEQSTFTYAFKRWNGQASVCIVD